MLVRAGLYARISEDRDGEGYGVERQVHDCLDLCRDLGWTVQEQYRDNDVSAYGRKARPRYQQMLADARAGKIDAIVAWSTDRLTRHPIELEEIITLHEQYKVKLATYTGHINLGTADGRAMARMAAVFARSEVEKMSDRIRREIQQRAEAGRPHGPVGYGYTRVNGKDVINEDEAAVIREIAERLLSGESVKAVTDSLNERGIEPPYTIEQRRRQVEKRNEKHRAAGEPEESFDPSLVKWSRVMVRHVALAERNAGLRRHRGQVIGKADWEPIYDEDTYHRLHALLGDPERKTTTGSAYRYLLTGIAKCGKCGAPVRVILGPRTRNGVRQKRRAYVCSRCHGISRDQAKVDQLITKGIVAFLATPGAAAVFQPVPDPALVTEAETLRAKLDEAADQFAADEIDGEQLRRITARLRPRLREVEAKLRPVMVDLEDLATPDIAERWDAIPLERRRAVVDYLLDIKLLPRGKDAPRYFDPASVKAEWKQRRAARLAERSDLWSGTSDSA
jgi:DNA invertase Pin-like site-specific DNA recombinase